jgi:hypothetical protein
MITFANLRSIAGIEKLALGAEVEDRVPLNG